MNVALPLVAPAPMANPYRLPKRTRLVLWLLSKCPGVDGLNLVPTRQYLDHCFARPAEKPRP